MSLREIVNKLTADMVERVKAEKKRGRDLLRDEIGGKEVFVFQEPVTTPEVEDADGS